MRQQSVRVMLASENPEARYLLREIVEEGNGAVIVAQAENATRAVTLARNLRPDVAIIDCYLPYTIGLDAIPLSRMSGLDTAQTISEEIPNIRVVLLSNLDTVVLPQSDSSSDVTALFSRERTGGNTPFTLEDLYQETEPLSTLVFANVETRPRVAHRQKIANISDKAILFGGLGILGGLTLMLTVIFAAAGLTLALAGAATMLLGLAGKLAVSVWPKTLRKTIFNVPLLSLLKRH